MSDLPSVQPHGGGRPGQQTSLLAMRDPRLKWAVVGSLVVHLLLVGGGLVAARVTAGPRIERGQKPITAKLVRLGEARDKKLLPRKFKVPPPPKPTRAAPAVPTPPKPEPTKPAPAPAPPKPEADEPPEPAPPRPETPERSDDPLARALARLGEIDPNADPDEVPPGDPEGDPSGDALEAGEGDRYLALVQRTLRANYQVPTIISDRERAYLNAVVTLHVAPDGAILSREISQSSGNDHFDNALLRAVDASNPLPPPPTAWRERFRREGLDLRFRP